MKSHKLALYAWRGACDLALGLRSAPRVEARCEGAQTDLSNLRSCEDVLIPVTEAGGLRAG